MGTLCKCGQPVRPGTERCSTCWQRRLADTRPASNAAASIADAARALGRIGGQSKSPAKAAAARANGRKAADTARKRGKAVGRPKKNRSAAIDTAQKDSVA